MANNAELIGGNGNVLSAYQVYRLAYDAGFRGQDAVIAVAVAKAESGLDPKSHNPKPPDNSYGLWQINMLGDMGPDRRKKFGLSSNEALFDPATNAKAAYAIYKGSGWKAWTTYTRGTYKKNLPATQAAIVAGAKADLQANGEKDWDGKSATDILKKAVTLQFDLSHALGEKVGEKAKELNPLLGIADSINAAIRGFTKGFVSTGAVLIGITLLVLGFALVMRETKLGKAAIGAGKGVVTKGLAPQRPKAVPAKPAKAAPVKAAKAVKKVAEKATEVVKEP